MPDDTRGGASVAGIPIRWAASPSRWRQDVRHRGSSRRMVAPADVTDGGGGADIRSASRRRSASDRRLLVRSLASGRGSFCARLGPRSWRQGISRVGRVHGRAGEAGVRRPGAPRCYANGTAKSQSGPLVAAGSPARQVILTPRSSGLIVSFSGSDAPARQPRREVPARRAATAPGWPDLRSGQPQVDYVGAVEVRDLLAARPEPGPGAARPANSRATPTIHCGHAGDHPCPSARRGRSGNWTPRRC